MVVLCESVAGSIVEEPILTTLCLLPLSVCTAPVFEVEESGTSVCVDMLDVTTDPSLFVVLTAIVVGTDVLLGACDCDACDCEDADC